MSRFVHLSRVGRRSLGSMPLLACFGVATPAPAVTIPAGETRRFGDTVPGETVRGVWDSPSPMERESLRQRKGRTSLDDLCHMPITRPLGLTDQRPGGIERSVP